MLTKKSDFLTTWAAMTTWNSSPSCSRVPAQPPGITWQQWNSLGNAVRHSAGLLKPYPTR